MGKAREWVFSALGSIGGALAGYLAFRLFARQGFYAMVLPGALMGLGCYALSSRRSTIRGILVGLSALVVGLLSEWSLFPFRADESLGYFLRNISRLNAITMLMIGLGAVFAAWWGRDARLTKPARSAEV